MKYGYARVSMPSQCLDLQMDALARAGCDKIFSEKISTRKAARPELSKLKSILQKGDVLVCYKLDRLGRSLRKLLDFIGFLRDNEVQFISISDGIDTTTTGSKLLLNIMMCIADFEREMISERTIAGLDSARRRGVKLGRPKGVTIKNTAKFTQVKILAKRGNSPSEIAKQVELSRPTVYKYLQL